MWGRSEGAKGISVSGYVFLLLLFNAPSSLLPLTSSFWRSWAFLWIFYTNTILQMSEWKNIKTLALQFYFSPPEGGGGEKVQERVSFISPIPLSVSSSISLLSAELSLSIPASFHFIHIQQSIIFRKKREWEREKQAERNPEIADGSGIFFFMFLSFRIWTGDVEKR